MNQSEHAQKIADRFKEIVENSGDTLSEEHLNELALLIEAGLDAALVDKLEQIADQLNQLSTSIRHNAEFTSSD